MGGRSRTFYKTDYCVADPKIVHRYTSISSCTESFITQQAKAILSEHEPAVQYMYTDTVKDFKILLSCWYQKKTHIKFSTRANLVNSAIKKTKKIKDRKTITSSSQNVTQNRFWGDSDQWPEKRRGDYSRSHMSNYYSHPSRETHSSVNAHILFLQLHSLYLTLG
jgi:hypothetical protein